MSITEKHLRQIIREELSRNMNESYRDEGTGYEYLKGRPNRVMQWQEGPVDTAWVQRMLRSYQESFPNSMPSMANELQAVLDSEPMDPDIITNYADRKGVSKMTWSTLSALIDAMRDPANKPAPPERPGYVRSGARFW